MNSREATAPRPAALVRSDLGAGGRARCLVIVGSRRDAINLFPVVHALREGGHIDPFVVLAGPHAELIEPIFDMAGVRSDADLRAGLAGRSVNHLIAGVVTRFDGLLGQLRRNDRPGVAAPSVALVHGSSTPALGAALASAGAQLPVIHIETDSGTNLAAAESSLPGDFNRRMLTRLATLSIAPTMADLGRLVSEGVPISEVDVTGSTAVDAFRWAAAQQAEWPDPGLRAVADTDRLVVLVDVRHPGPKGTDPGAVAAAVTRIATARPDVSVVVPMHPDPTVRATLLPVVTGLPNVVVTQPLPYPVHARLVARATLAVSDSVSLQQEAPGVGTPVLVTNQTTRRQMGSEAGTTLFVGSDPAQVAQESVRLLADRTARHRMKRSPNPFGDGSAARRIVLAMEHPMFDGPSPAPFGRDGAWALPAQRPSEDRPARRVNDPVTSAFAELSELAACTPGSLTPDWRGQQDR